MQIVRCPKCDAPNRVDESRLGQSEAKCGRCSTPLRVAASGGGKPVVITDQTFQSEVLQSSTPVLLDAWAPWCGPCRVVAPVMDQLAAEANGAYRIAKLNVDENPATASQFQISSIPTMLIFKNGKLVDRIVGAMPKNAIEARLRSIL
jgi:thioredoxin 2